MARRTQELHTFAHLSTCIRHRTAAYLHMYICPPFKIIIYLSFIILVVYFHSDVKIQLLKHQEFQL